MQDRCLVRDPSGGRLEERDCDKSGVHTLHEWKWITADPTLPGALGWWEFVCLGQSGEDFAAAGSDSAVALGAGDLVDALV